MNLFEAESEDDWISGIIEPEVIEVAAHKREHKPKTAYEKMFDNLPHRKVLLDNLPEEEKICLVCGTQMVSVDTEVARTESVFHKAVLER